MDGVSTITRVANKGIGKTPMPEMEILSADEIFERRMSLAGRNFPLSKEYDISWLADHQNTSFSKISEIILALKKDTPYVKLDNNIKVKRESLFPVLKGICLACQAVDRLMSGAAKRAICITKTTGDIEKSEEALGYAYMSNAAIAAHYVLRKNPSWRIAMIDFDLGHDCSTGKMVEGMENILVVSAFVDENKKEEDVLKNAPSGNCKSVRIPKIINRKDLEEMMINQVFTEIREFGPDLIILSTKPSDEGGLGIPAGFKCEFMNKGLMDLAEKTADGRFILILEGALNDRDLLKCRSLFGSMAS